MNKVRQTSLFSKIVFTLFLILTAITLFFGSWTALHGDVYFHTDVARDMFLFEEILQKKIIMIGPRSSVGGLFHGPLWSYITLPGYLIGGGNPVVVEWWWMTLFVLTLLSWFFLANKLFGKVTAMLYILMTSMYFLFHSNALTNADGATFTIPIFFYFIVRYYQEPKIKFLLTALVVLAAIIQFQMAIGYPLLALSIPYTIFVAIRKKHPWHLLSYIIIPILLTNFIIFDIRHENILLKNVFRHLQATHGTSTLNVLVADRIRYVFTRIEFVRFGPSNFPIIIMTLFCIILLAQLIHNRYKQIYLTFLYFFLGYFIISLINRFTLLPQYVAPLTPLLFLIFCSFVTSKYSKFFYVLFFLMYALNCIGAYRYIQALNRFIGYDQYSWKAIYGAASSLYKGEPKEFGYFVYAPDIVGYGPRYAMEYAGRVYNKKGYAFVKKPITYLFIETAARNNPFTSKEIWKYGQIHITSVPVFTKTFYNGYSYEKHILTEEEQNMTFDPGANPGLFYR